MTQAMQTEFEVEAIIADAVRSAQLSLDHADELPEGQGFSSPDEAEDSAIEVIEMELGRAMNVGELDTFRQLWGAK